VYSPSESVSGDHCTYVPNTYYYEPAKIRWSKIIVKYLVDPNAQLAALRTGQIDVAFSVPYQIVPVATASGFRVVRGAGAVTGLYILDEGGKLTPPLADVRVRQALNYAIDRKTLAHALIGPDSTPTSQMFPTPEVDPKYDDYYTYDPAKAKALLAAAGYRNGFTFKTFTCGVWCGAVATTSLAQAIAKELAAVGVTMDVTDTPTPDDWTQAYLGHAFATWTIALGLEPVWNLYQDYFRTGSADGDQHGWHDPVIDRLWLKGERLPHAQAEKIWRQILTRAVTQAYAVPIGVQPFRALVSKKVGGILPTFDGFGTNSVNEWYPTGS
jgi:peptide/nickel transport system substrate-binding protein